MDSEWLNPLLVCICIHIFKMDCVSGYMLYLKSVCWYLYIVSDLSNKFVVWSIRSHIQGEDCISYPTYGCFHYKDGFDMKEIILNKYLLYICILFKTHICKISNDPIFQILGYVCVLICLQYWRVFPIF